MKNIKKIIALVLSLVMVFAFAACGETYADSKYSKELTEDGYFAGVQALDYVTLPDYSSIKVTKADVMEYINQSMAEYSEDVQIEARKIENLDKVNIDYVGYIDDVAFEGGDTQGNGTTVQIGVTSYIPGFLDQLIGHEPGDRFDLWVTFPEDYGVESLNGKLAKFDTTINYLVESTIPEFNDDNVSKYFSSQYGWTTADEMFEYYKNYATFIYVMQYAVVDEVPESVVDYYVDEIVYNLEDSAEDAGMDLDSYIYANVYPSTGLMSIDDIKTYVYQESYYNGLSALIMQAVAEKEELVVKAKDLREYFATEMGSSYYGEYKKFYGLPYLIKSTREDMVMKLLAEHLDYQE